MRILIEKLNKYLKDDIKIVACCCGHKKYPISLIVQQMYASGEIFTWDMCSDTLIPRKRKFYVRDKQGYYYIPETLTINKKDVGLPPT